MSARTPRRAVRHAKLLRRAAPSACVLLGLLASSARAFCPCYTASSAQNTNDCGVEAVAGTNPTVDEWQSIFALVSRGPTAWGTLGPSVDPLTEGCGTATPHPVHPFFPCELVKAITRHESTWRQFCEPTTPSDMVGRSSRTIISFDCGYGIAQVTSGMHSRENPPFDRSRVAAEPTYNLATGMRIFADKWSYRCVGAGYPVVLEHWYSAVWAYNGFAYSNNPNNAAYSSTRGVWDPSVGNAAPYQEKIFGRLEHPPSGLWDPVLPAYPDPRDVGSGSSPPALPEPTCASPTDCAASRRRNVSSCFTFDGGATPPVDGGPTAPEDDGGTSVDAGRPSRDGGGTPSADGGLAPASDVLGAPPVGCGCNCGIGSASLAALLGVWWVRPRRRPYPC